MAEDAEVAVLNIFSPFQLPLYLPPWAREAYAIAEWLHECHVANRLWNAYRERRTHSRQHNLASLLQMNQRYVHHFFNYDNETDFFSPVVADIDSEDSEN